MSTKKCFVLVFFMSSYILGCGVYEANQSESKFVVSSSDFLPPGHEKLLGIAIAETNKLLKHQLFEFSYPTIDIPEIDVSRRLPVSGFRSINPLIRGVYLTDYPGEFRIDELNLAVFAGGVLVRDNIKDWHDRDYAQKYHFLRRNQPLQSAREACMESTREIERLSFSAVRSNSFDQNLALNYLGVATHIIQDSFSEAHTVRNGYILQDVCNWGKEWEGICNHGVLGVVEDLVINPESSLNRRAIESTRDYLILMANVIYRGKNLHSGVAELGKKYFDCSSLEFSL